jgi:hypothetical protein
MMGTWYVIAIDWKHPNVLDEVETEERAKIIANAYDEMALRAIAVPEGDPRIKGRAPHASRS